MNGDSNNQGLGKLGQLVVRDKLVTMAQYQKAKSMATTEGGRVAHHLVKLGFLKAPDLLDFLSKEYGLPTVNLEEFEVDPEVIKLFKDKIAIDLINKYNVLPLSRGGNTLTMVIADPATIPEAHDDLRFLTKYEIIFVLSTEESIRESIVKHFSQELDSLEKLDIDLEDVEDEGAERISETELTEAGSQEPVVRLVDLIIKDAIIRKASDIHFETYKKMFRIRYRIDGVLYEIKKPRRDLRDAVVSRLKIMSRLDIAERRLPQDGRINKRFADGGEINFRVSTLPKHFGEDVVMRILDQSNLNLDLQKLGFEKNQLALYEEAVAAPWGMILVTGPTGSGKTTTLYSTLHKVNTTDRKILTVEDPVEYELQGVNQVHVKEEIGLTFANALRAFLRQDPDVIMVGEIRDFETAEIAIKSALTGHLVFSTLHTNDAPSSVSRLLNMGVEPFLVVDSIRLVIAQRLVRRICPMCKEEAFVNQHDQDLLHLSPDDVASLTLYKGKGCKNCSNSGYKGRDAIYEVMPLSSELKSFVLNGAQGVELKREAVRLGMITLREAALIKLKRGVTTVEEVLRNSASDD